MLYIREFSSINLNQNNLLVFRNYFNNKELGLPNHFIQPNAKARWFFKVQRNLASLEVDSGFVLSNFASAVD